MSRLGICHQRISESIRSDGPMRCMPEHAFILYEEHLWRFMPHAESLCDCIRKPAVFDNQHSAAHEVIGAFDKIDKLFIGLRADRTLRAMLENQNGIRFRCLEKLFKI